MILHWRNVSVGVHFCHFARNPKPFLADVIADNWVLLRFVPNLDPDLDLDDLDLDLDPRSSQTLDLPQIW